MIGNVIQFKNLIPAYCVLSFLLVYQVMTYLVFQRIHIDVRSLIIFLLTLAKDSFL